MLVLIGVVLLIPLIFLTKKFLSTESTFKRESVIQQTDLAVDTYASTKIKSFDNEPDWVPGEAFNTSNQPEIAGESALLVDLNSGKVLFEKNSTKRMPIASLVKVMTAVVALEHKNINDNIFVSSKAASIGENSMGITANESYTLEELMYGLLLNSGNDSAYTIAEGAAGDSETFVKWMNIKSTELGLKNSYFADPSGLDDTTYSTTVDLLKLSKYAMKDENFRKIVKTFNYEIFASETHKYIYLENQTNLLTSYPGVEGIKTGYTEDAGLCLITYAKNNGVELLGVVLNSVDRKGDMILMLDHGFSTMGVVVEHHLLDY